jgi:hopanoid-associated phosphorylase
LQSVTELADRSSSASLHAVLTVVGLMFEARILAGSQTSIICRHAEAELDQAIRRALGSGCRCLLSFGTAGGLHPALQAGDCIVASEIADRHRVHRADILWSRKLAAAIPGARTGRLVGVDGLVPDVASKRELHLQSGALAADMESHIVARAAARNGLAFAAIRVVLDPARRSLPQATRMAIDERGDIDIARLLRNLRGSPSQLPALIRLTSDAYLARNKLAQVCRTLGPGLGWPQAADVFPGEPEFATQFASKVQAYGA